ncbi:MAG: hypothetical protein AB7O28_20860 [Vicinamibacterales bacterium]
MTRRLVLFVLAFAARPSTAAARQVTARDLRGAIDRLMRAVAPFDRPRLSAAAVWLRNNQERSDLARLTPEYVRTLERAAGALERRPPPPVVDDVTRELEAKVDHCRRLGIGMGGTVALRVNTRRGGTAVPEWQVLYLLKFDEWLKTPPRTFPRVSTPTSAQVEPGRYWVWARDPASGATSERVLVQVAGAASLVVDVPVP